MPAVPVQHDWLRGELATATEMNDNIANPITFYRQRPMFLASYITDQSISSGTGWQALFFATGDVWVDSENMHDPGRTGGSTDSRITIIRSGLYDIRAQYRYTANANGVRRAKVEVVKFSNGSRSVIQESGAASSGSTSYLHGGGGTSQDTTVRLADIGYPLAAGDYLEFSMGQNSGSTLNLRGAASDRVSWFCVRWVASS